MTLSQSALRELNALLLTDGWEVIEQPPTGRVYAHGDSVLAVNSETADRFTIAGFVRLRIAEANEEGISCWSGPEADGVTSFAIGAGGGLLDVEELVPDALAQRVQTVTHRLASVREHLDLVVSRTDAAVRRRTAPFN